MASRLEGRDVFKHLRPEQVNAINDVADVVMFEAGDAIYERGQMARYAFVVLEGEVALRLPGPAGVSVPIDLLTRDSMFGSCICFDHEKYMLTAQCTKVSKILRIGTETFRALMDDDPRMGYTLQSWISRIYFQRYVDTMTKLQSVVMNLQVEAGS